jgi:hypothetical protein
VPECAGRVLPEVECGRVLPWGSCGGGVPTTGLWAECPQMRAECLSRRSAGRVGAPGAECLELGSVGGVPTPAGGGAYTPGEWLLRGASAAEYPGACGAECLEVRAECPECTLGGAWAECL